MQIKNMKSYKIIVFPFIFLVVGFVFGWYYRPTTEAIVAKDTMAEARGADLTQFWRVWDILNQKHYSSASTTADKKIWGAIKGLAESYGDDYTEFMPPEESKEFNDSIKGKLEGVGMEVGKRNNIITVIAPIKGSPADKAGVLSGDKIIEIDGKKIDGFTVDQAVKLIRGPKGTKVTLTLYREGATELIKKEIVRDVINIPTLDKKIESGSRKKDDVFVIKLHSFNEQSATLFRQAIIEYEKSGLNKLIIDLRDNPGGYLESSVDMASFFIPKGKTVVVEDFGDKKVAKSILSLGHKLLDVSKHNIVVLVNGGSASASEILAGALKEHNVAKLVGVKTFGKGTVQELFQLAKNTSLKVTIAKWLTPNGINISLQGIEPDYKVEMTIDDINKGVDPQMKKALEIVRKPR